jgi:hypothetical protein
MGNELQMTVTERIKVLLQIDGECSIFELDERLRQYRNESHPDKFQHANHKEKAEARFKDANSLLEELEKQIEFDRLNRKPSELALYRPLYDAALLQSALDKFTKDLEKTECELMQEREANARLEKRLQDKSNDELAAEIKHLKQIYNPSSRRYASLGIAIVLSGTLAVMTQMEKVSSVLERYSPFEKHYISTSLFICLILLLAAMVRKVWESGFIQRRSEEVCSPRYAEDFLQYLQEKKLSEGAVNEFSEVEAFDFISGENSWLRTVLSFFGFDIFNRETTNRLKEIFLHNLLNKKLVDFSRAERMQRYFKISNTRESTVWFDLYMAERAKNQTLAVADEF